MALINTAKPAAPSLTNATRVVSYETWDTNTTTFDTETRNWDAMGAEMTNTRRPSFGYLWGALSYPWLELTPWDNQYEGQITNTAKPA